MNEKKKTPLPAFTNEEIAALIESLHHTEQRLEQLTAGEVDTVADRDGRTFLLRRAQDHLRHSEAAKQAAILNALPAHIALLDTEGTIISVNEAWRRFASANALQNPEYGIGLDYLDICDSAQGDNALEAHQAAAGIRSVLAGETRSFSLEYPCHSPAEQRWFLMTSTPLADDRRNGAVVMHVNITERKRAELALRESEARFRSLTAMSSDFYWESDAEHRLTARASASKKQSMVSVFQRGAQIGERRWEIAHLSPDEAGWQAHRATLDAHLPFRDFELSRLGADGAERYISISGEPVFDASGAFEGYRGVGTDITEGKRAEDALRQSRNLLQAVLENVPSRIFWKDRDLRYLGSNTRFAKDAGHARPDELIGKTDFEMGWKDQAELYRSDDRAVMASGVPKPDIEEPQTTPDGSTIWLRTSKVPLRDNENRIIGVLGLYDDITERKRAAQELRESELRFKQMAESINDVFFLQNPEGSQIYYVSPAYEQVWGRTCESLYANAMSWAESIHPDDLDYAFTKFNEGRHTGFDYEFRIVRADGDVRWIHVRGFPILDGAGHSYRTAGVASDITQRKQSEIKVKRLNRVYAVLSGINTTIVRTQDRQELFEEVCRITVDEGEFRLAWIGLLDVNGLDVTPVARAGIDDGYLDNIELTAREGAPDRCELVARALREKTSMVCDDIGTDPQMVRWREEALQRGYRSVAVLPLQLDDKVMGLLLLYASEAGAFDNEEMRLLNEIAGDISFALDHIHKQTRLDYLAYYDVLTGLANRTLFFERVQQYCRSAAGGGHKLAVFLIDLERFKNINDSLGRPAGDALLRQVAEWLTQNAGDANLVARLGADHFAAVLPVVKQEGDVARMLEKMMAAFLEHPFRLNDAVFRINGKVGVALFPDDGADADTLFRHAEAALKKAKASGEHYLFYRQEMTEKVAGKLTLENQLREALDNEEFVLHYQPKVNLASGKVTSAEALIRWNDPRTGLVPPGRFIPVLEETGLIYDVGRWALRQAITDYLRWRAAGLAAVRIAVNVSPLQLRNRGFVEEIRQTIGIDAHAAAGLELEITESLIMEDVKGTIASLGAIRAMGVPIAIDDFGTGFSSLSYLAKLPVDTLKIDRSFVVDMTVGPEGLALVSTIIGLAHSLNLKVVAEGVETEEQSRLLRLLACDEMQGYLFSKPVPAEIFETRFLAPPPAE